MLDKARCALGLSTCTKFLLEDWLESRGFLEVQSGALRVLLDQDGMPLKLQCGGQVLERWRDRFVAEDAASAKDAIKEYFGAVETRSDLLSVLECASPATA